MPAAQLWGWWFAPHRLAAVSVPPPITKDIAALRNNKERQRNNKERQ